ncbi:MAG TPA: hypothetical protein VG890_04665, partial [Puia sp.]|nr:hypothetical protein [Puia sp.]
RNAIYIDSNPRFDDLQNESENIPSNYRQFFDSIVSLQPILVKKNGRVERKFSVFLCTRYHPPRH